MRLNDLLAWLTHPRAVAFYKATVLLLALVVMASAFQKLARYGLPSATGAGHKDDQSAVWFLFALLWSTLLLRPLIGRALFVVLLTVALAFTVSNWWFYEFYRDFISPGNLKLLLYAKEGTFAWDGVSNKLPALLFAAAMAFATVVIFHLDKWRPSRLAIIVVALILMTAAAQQQLEYSTRATGGLAHRGVNHFGFFFRQLYADEVATVDARHVASLTRLYPTKQLGEQDTSDYPLYKVSDGDRALGHGKNVLIIVLESVRAAESGTYGHSPSVTPQLDEIAGQSLVARNAYANSNQTVRGEVALLCSAIDYLNGAPYSMGGVPIKTNCLPAMLGDAGFTTHWIHGYKKEFFNRGEFFPLLGFEHIHDRATILEAGYTHELGWGVADPDMFDYALQVLRESKKPFFAEILTLSNHYPYLWDWQVEFPPELALPPDFDKESKFVYPGYLQGMYYTDMALGRFWRKFKASELYDQTLVVIVADHGIWTFDRKLQKAKGLEAEFRRNETYFRVPLLFHAADLKPGAIETPVSQVDVAPTVLDYLQLERANAFLGESVLATRGQAHGSPIFFIASGSYGFRDGDVRCYPVDKTAACSDAYRKCKQYRKTENAPQFCVSSTTDLLRQPKDLELEPVDYDLADSQRFIELTQHWLKQGFLPTEAIYNKEVLRRP